MKLHPPMVVKPRGTTATASLKAVGSQEWAVWLRYLKRCNRRYTRQAEEAVTLGPNGCMTAALVLRLGIHHEVERPATLNRSKPSTAGATINNPAFRIPTVR